METLEEVMAKYKLTKEDHDRIGQEIISIVLHDKYPVENPQAIIDIAPPASGKTGLNAYGTEQFIDKNVVIINSDEFKPFHPHIEEIAKLYPEYYTKVTDQESNTWTSNLFDFALSNGYNIIFEGPGRNARILNTIREKMQNHTVTVRGMSVNELNCLMSILERYELQVRTKGWGRLVTLDHFYQTYNNMPETIDEIEKSGVVDFVEVFRRGDKPSRPKKVYSSDVKDNSIPSAKSAVLKGRLDDKEGALKSFYEKRDFLKKLIRENGDNPEVSKIINRIMDIVIALEDRTHTVNPNPANVDNSDLGNSER